MNEEEEERKDRNEFKIPLSFVFSLIEEIVHQVDGKIDEEANDGQRDYVKR